MRNRFKLGKEEKFLLFHLVTGGLRCLWVVRKFWISSTEERHGWGQGVGELTVSMEANTCKSRSDFKADA